MAKGRDRQSAEQGPSALEREIEETRERLAATIDELIHRANPKTIVSREVADLKAFFVNPATGEPRTENILKVAGGVVGTVALFVLIRKVTRTELTRPPSACCTTGSSSRWTGRRGSGARPAGS